jgi:spore coat polysaccharide biosynthesis protein SpsF
MSRKLVAALACRSNGKRLYGKPLQNLVTDYSILDHIIAQLSAITEIDEIVLGISEGIENHAFIEYAQKNNLTYVIGDEEDVLHRLVMCGRISNATDIFRITTECPFIWLDDFSAIWNKHINEKNDTTVVDMIPEGTAFELYTLDSLEKSHANGTSYHRSEGCSRYIRENQDDFKVCIIQPPKYLQRMDVRLTVDYPEDLVVCRKIYDALSDDGPHISLEKIIQWWDQNPDLTNLLKDYVYDKPIWLEPETWKKEKYQKAASAS